jgi:hypothetical protein
MRVSKPILALWLAALLAPVARAEDGETPRPPTPASEGASGRAWIAHQPLASVPLGDLELRFDVRGGDLAGDIVVYYRPLVKPAATVHSVRAQRTASGFVARIAEASVPGDGIAYWVVERDRQGTERAVFASSAAPQPLQVYPSSDAAREQRLLRLAGGRRSRVTLRGERVDMGAFRVSDPRVPSDRRDSYYHLEGQYAYRFFRSVEELEVGIGYLDGELLDTQRLERERRQLGYGRTAITFALGNWLRLRPGLVLGISQVGFEAGGDLGVSIGERDGTEFELYGGFVSRLGGQLGARLGWSTVPRVPMGARIEITNFPNNEDFGVRLLFDIGYRMSDALLVRFIGGYRGRTSLAGGPSLALSVDYAF